MAGHDAALKRWLDESGLFTVDVATSPAKGGDMSKFQPDFAAYNVIVSNYNGEEWSETTKAALVNYVRSGGGLVIVHAADNAFPKWKEWNEMIGLGGWGGRNEKSGPYLRYRDDKLVRNTRQAPAVIMASSIAFQVVVRDPSHPIVAGLPKAWMHAQDELYDQLRGPAENIDVLATAYSDMVTGGSGEHEPSLMTVDFGKGAIFHTTQGHGVEAMHCVGFITTLVRGTEWAAVGKVTKTDVPKDFPTAEKVSVRHKRD